MSRKRGRVDEFVAEGLDASLFKSLIDALEDQFTTASFLASEEYGVGGMEAEMLTETRVMIAKVQMKRDLFSSFVCPQPTAIHVSLQNLRLALRAAKKGDRLAFRAEAGAPASLEIHVQGADHASDVLMRLNLLDLEAEKFDVVECEFPCVVELAAPVFARAVSTLKDIGDVCEVRVRDSDAGESNSELLFSSESGDFGKSTFRLNSKCDAPIAERESVPPQSAASERPTPWTRCKPKQPRSKELPAAPVAIYKDPERSFRVCFRMSYLVYVCKFFSAFEHLQLALQEEMPLRVRFGDGASGLCVTLYMAPSHEVDASE